MTIPEGATAQQIFERGWRQGGLLDLPAIQHLQAEGHLTNVEPTEDHVLVITQDCDLVHGSFENEPVVELLVLKAAPKRESSLTYGKSPRRLHLDLESSTGQVSTFEAKPHYRTSIPRQYLALFAPSAQASLPTQGLRSVREWFAKRYQRSALPSTFNDRIRPQQRPIERVLRGKHEFVKGIYLAFNTEAELAETEEYKIVVIGEMFNDTYANEMQRRQAEDLIRELARLLELCPGIKATNHNVYPREQITLSDLETMQFWDYDFLSNEDAAD